MCGQSKVQAKDSQPKDNYTGKPYQDTENTRFAAILKNGSIAVIKASYFENCLSKREPFADRENIPEEYFISGDNLMRQWKKHGARFLVIFSYAWLDAAHPDPDLWHLHRIVRILTEIKSCHDFCSGDFRDEDVEIGVIIDYCSLWQRGSGEVDKRSAVQLEEFGEGLKEINTPYAHQEVTAVKLMAVPDKVARKYDDRGWTLFESIIIDGKAPSPITGGISNFLVFDDDFNHVFERALSYSFVDKFSGTSERQTGFRAPPCTPKRFDRMMQERKDRAEKKKVKLFTSGKDQDFITDKYAKAFKEQVNAKRFAFGQTHWGDREMEILAEALEHCTCLESLDLDNNNITDVGVDTLVAVLPKLRSLKRLNLSCNPISNVGVEKLVAMLPKLTSLEFFMFINDPDNNLYGPRRCSAAAESKLKAVSNDVIANNKARAEEDKKRKQAEEEAELKAAEEREQREREALEERQKAEEAAAKEMKRKEDEEARKRAEEEDQKKQAEKEDRAKKARLAEEERLAKEQAKQEIQKKKEQKGWKKAFCRCLTARKGRT